MAGLPYPTAPPSNYPPQSNVGIYPPPVQSYQNRSTVSKLEIHISCNDLKDKDTFSKSDPVVFIFTEVKSGSGKSWHQIDRTEVITDSLNPKFTKAIPIDYNFEEYQRLKFVVYDSDIGDADYLGYVEMTLGSIVGEHCGNVTKNLLDSSGKPLKSTITINAEEISNSKEELFLDIQGIKLDKKDTFGASDPFLVFHRLGIENNSYIAVHKTEVIKNTLNPHWKPFGISLVTLCNGDKLRPLKIECFDWDADGSHDLIGECDVTVDMLEKHSTTPLQLINPKKKSKKKNYKNSGQLQFSKVALQIKPSFLDYITSGVEICCHIAIDFTASNGNVRNPSSLHYQDPNFPNQYAQALQSVGRIVEDYDTDKLIPAYGFGARINGQVYHNFHLNQTPNPNCYGIHSVVGAYHQFLQYVELYGPTNFSPVINSVANQIMSENALTTKYHILLILTDGVITDMEMTKLAIIRASKLPLSIIIVGIGNADFDAMDELDSDDRRLKVGTEVAKRDVVQFVPFRKFSGGFAGDALAKEVLREVPNQLVTYMSMNQVECKRKV